MAAPDFSTLYDFDTPMELAVSSAIGSTLAMAGLTDVQITASRDSETHTCPRVEVYFSLGAALAQRITTGQTFPKPVPNAFNADVTVRIVSTRPIPEDNGALHGIIRGWVRYALSAGARAIPPPYTPFWQIMDFLPASGQPQLIDEKQQDVSELHYAMIFAIREDAWPEQGDVVAPEITDEPQNVATQPGTPVSFSVTATGDSLIYQWRHNGSLILGAVSSTYDIAAAQAEDTGDYDVIVSNSAGALLSDTATLTFQE